MAINDWQNGRRVWNELAAVRDVRYCPERLSGPKLTADIFDASGSRKAKMWQPSPQQAQWLQSAENGERPLLRVSGLVDGSGPWAGEVTLEGVVEVEDGDEEAAHFRVAPALPGDHPARVAALDRLIAGIRDPYLSALLAETIGSRGDLREAYLVATAAKKNHHAFAGGLLRHSVEVARLALACAGAEFPGLLDPDLLTTAALLHDIGKLWEMDQSEWRRGRYSEDGELLGHIFLGAAYIDDRCRRLEMPHAQRTALLHLILSHHEQKEWGSPVTPQSPEAVLLAKCDQLSAELHKHENEYAAGRARPWQGKGVMSAAPLSLAETAQTGLEALA